jgi:hypothetical protein
LQGSIAPIEHAPPHNQKSENRVQRSASLPGLIFDLCLLSSGKRMARRPGAAPGIAGFGNLRAQLVRGVLYLNSEKRNSATFHPDHFRQRFATGDWTCWFSFESIPASGGSERRGGSHGAMKGRRYSILEWLIVSASPLFKERTPLPHSRDTAAGFYNGRFGV